MITRRERLLKAIEGIRHTSKVRQSGRAASFDKYAMLTFPDRFFSPRTKISRKKFRLSKLFRTFAFGMEERLIFTKKEKTETLELLHQLKDVLASSLQEGDEAKMHAYMKRLLENNEVQRDVFGLNPIHQSLKTAMLAAEEEGLKRDGVLAILLALLFTAFAMKKLTREPKAAPWNKPAAAEQEDQTPAEQLHEEPAPASAPLTLDPVTESDPGTEG